MSDLPESLSWGVARVFHFAELSTETRVKCANFGAVQEEEEEQEPARETRPLHHAVLAKREASEA